MSGYSVRRYKEVSNEMKSYDDAVKCLKNRNRRKLENNTYIERRSADAIAVRLHETDVVTYPSDGNIVLNSGGWRMVTTKDRITTYAPIGISQSHGVWYVIDNGPERTIWGRYADGMTIKDGTFSGFAPEPSKKNSDVKLKKEIKEYCKAFIDALYAFQVNAPGAGDCFYCGMREVKTGRPLGEITSNDHLREHMKERYFVPSLLARAEESFGLSVAAKNDIAVGFLHVGKFWGMKYELVKTLYRYMSRQFGYAS